MCRNTIRHGNVSSRKCDILVRSAALKEPIPSWYEKFENRPQESRRLSHVVGFRNKVRRIRCRRQRISGTRLSRASLYPSSPRPSLSRLVYMEGRSPATTQPGIEEAPNDDETSSRSLSASQLPTSPKSRVRSLALVV